MHHRIEASSHFQYHETGERRCSRSPRHDENRGHIALGLTIIDMILGWGAFFLWVLL